MAPANFSNFERLFRFLTATAYPIFLKAGKVRIPDFNTVLYNDEQGASAALNVNVFEDWQHLGTDHGSSDGHSRLML